MNKIKNPFKKETPEHEFFKLEKKINERNKKIIMKSKYIKTLKEFYKI